MTLTAMYLVRRKAFDGGYSAPITDSFSSQGSYTDTVGPRDVAVAVFPTEKAAAAEAHRMNVEAQAARSPFWFSREWEELTDLSVDEAAARLVRKGFTTPPARHPDDTGKWLWRTCDAWREWWDRESVNWREQQLADAWAVFPKLRFYDVIEIEIED